MKIIVYSVNGHTWLFNDVSDIEYHSKNLKFNYVGQFGKTKAQFNDIAGIIKIGEDN